MKRVAVAAILMAVMILCCGTALIWLHSSIRELSGNLEQAEAMVTAQYYEEAAVFLTGTAERWKKQEHFFSRLLRHQEMESITQNLVSLPSYLRYKDLSNFHASIQQIRQMLQHIWEAELPVWSNFL